MTHWEYHVSQIARMWQDCLYDPLRRNVVLAHIIDVARVSGMSSERLYDAALERATQCRAD